MPTFDSIAAALAHVKKIAKEVLYDDVADIVRIVEREHIYSDVYSRPTSERYQRRYDNNGLGSIGNITKVAEGDSVSIFSIADFNPYKNGVDEDDGISRNAGRGDGLDGLVNYGNGWNGINYDWYPCDSTNYIENTANELRTTKEHIKIMKQGLQKRGLTVK